jgi:hypothetical protein
VALIAGDPFQTSSVPSKTRLESPTTMRPKLTLTFPLLPLTSAIFEFDLSKFQHDRKFSLSKYQHASPDGQLDDSGGEGKSNYLVDNTGTATYIPLPSTDTWYRAPDGWESTTPGTVLKVRHHAYNTTLLPLANVKEVFQVRVRA